MASSDKKLIHLDDNYALVEYEDGRVHRVNRETRKSEKIYTEEEGKLLKRLASL